MSENQDSNPTSSADATDPIKLAQEFGLAGFGVLDKSNTASTATSEMHETEELVRLAKSVGLEGY